MNAKARPAKAQVARICEQMHKCTSVEELMAEAARAKAAMVGMNAREQNVRDAKIQLIADSVADAKEWKGWA